MEVRLVVLATFENSGAAHVTRVILEGAGIHAEVAEESNGNTFWMINPATKGVKLMVLEKDVIPSRAALDDVFPDEGPEHSWTCPQCKETVDAGFSVCWSCGNDWPGAAETA